MSSLIYSIYNTFFGESKKKESRLYGWKKVACKNKFNLIRNSNFSITIFNISLDLYINIICIFT